MTARALALALGVGVAACPRGEDPTILPPYDVAEVDGGGDERDCDRACERLGALGCPEARPTRAGLSCSAVCARNADLLPTGCVAAARSIAEVRACGVRCGAR